MARFPSVLKQQETSGKQGGETLMRCFKGDIFHSAHILFSDRYRDIECIKKIEIFSSWKITACPCAFVLDFILLFVCF